MFFQLLDGAPVGVIVVIAVSCTLLAVARVVRNLPKDSINKFFEHQTSKYRIIAGDTQGRLAVVQKQRLLFMAFLCACVAVVLLGLMGTTRGEAEAPGSPPTPTQSQSTR
ncbi:hypothetical protein ACIRBX_09070 [Kitasatospora sp. NPDC096147]|uniref:hypothetical protein n=1 Tax=Kitasatospora sp. NPDC096147 TaxID=3364093 RepID=UPI00380944FF